MATTPYVRFYWSDWIADTSHLDLMQLGAYMRLLEHVYQHGRPLPGDMQRVFRICHATSTTEQETIRSILAEYFMPCEDPEHGLQWRHLRAEREMEWSKNAHGTRVEKASRAARARWDTGKDDAPSNAPSISQAMLKQCSSNANQNQNQNQEEKPTLLPADETPPGVDQQAWADFTEHRHEIRKPLTKLSATKTANILRTLTPDQQRTAVDTSIANRWTGVFPPKHNGANHAATNRVDYTRQCIELFATGAGYSGQRQPDERVVSAVYPGMGGEVE